MSDHGKAFEDPQPKPWRPTIFRCHRPRFGWYCKLSAFHDGPCPAWPRLWRHPLLWFGVRRFR